MPTHSTDHNAYAMALVDAIAAHLRAEWDKGQAPTDGTPIDVPGGAWLLTRGDVAPRWCVTRDDHGRAVKILRFADAIDPVAAVMLAFDELRPLDLWPTDVAEAVSAHA